MDRLLLFVIFISFVVKVAETTAACPNGFSLINQKKCLKIFPNHLKHLQAEMDCTSFGGTLANVKTAIDNRAIVNLAANAGASYTWVGMFCFGNDTSTCYHDDGSGQVTYSNFASGFPKVDSRFGGCVYMATTGKNSGQWLTGPCQVTGFTFICEVPTTVNDATCNHNYNGYCYLPSHEIHSEFIRSNTTFDQAEVICQEYGSKLASIHSKREIDFIRGMFKGVSFNKIFIGGRDSAPNAMRWVDGTQFDYSYFDPIAITNGSCLQMDTFDRENNGMWSRVDCEKMNYFLCKRTIGGVGMKERKQLTSPKFRNVAGLQNAVATTESFPDFSHCNTTLYLAPGVVTSYGYPIKTPPTFCTWKIAVIGPYRVGLYFTDFSVASDVNIYDEYGNQIGRPFGNKNPFQTLAPTNIVLLTHDSRYDGPAGDHGFSVQILPY